jgi:hypothetical protein
MEFPCSVHKDTYENSRIATTEEELAQFEADGWATSNDFQFPPKKAATKAKTEGAA